MENWVPPLKFTRILLLFLTWAWALITLGAAINVVLQAKSQLAGITSEIPSFVKIAVSATDVEITAVISILAAAVIFGVSSFSLFILLFNIWRARKRTRSNDTTPLFKPPLSTRTLTFQYIALGLLAVIGLAAQIPLSLFVATHSPSVAVSASVLGLDIPIPNSVLQLVEGAGGVKTAYASFPFLTLLAILPYFAFIFALAAAVTSFLASRRARRARRNSSSSSIDALTPAPKHVKRSAKGKRKVLRISKPLPALDPEKV
ncbi:hypothetical protein B0H19DRAFT_1255884 [Mycena capillaripes]|nr:hypothetical protein B0H19DRAFT_1255884 [Mycena capillaripes]